MPYKDSEKRKALQRAASQRRRDAMTPEQRSARTVYFQAYMRDYRVGVRRGRPVRGIPRRFRGIEIPRPKPAICEVCGNPDRIHLDHCHLLGVFRGWLCSGCNVALGMVKDSPERLRALAAYLEKFYS